MVRAQFSQRYEAIRSRIRRLPELYEEMLSAMQEGDARRTRELFRNGILGRELRLTPLTEHTIRAKRDKGYAEPETPLYGLGDSGRNTYAHMMEVVKESEGRQKRWIVRPRDDRHHESGLPLSAMFIIHEFGTTIGNAFGRGITVRIPPRPAFRYAYRKLMRERAQRDDTERVQAAIAQYVRRGDRRAMKQIQKRRR